MLQNIINYFYIRYLKNTLIREGIFYFFDKTKGKMVVIGL
ncbi:hypothetical protein CLC_2438 [Clostridium botulinum A str. Hall]|nr:hypothetical protein CLC_2438 [Clostridium botulinum A str. Hall]